MGIEGRTSWPAAAAMLTLLLAPGALARADSIRTLETEIDGNVVAIEGEGDALVVKTADRSVPVAEVKEVRFPAAEREVTVAPVHIFLVTGDELAGEVVAGDDAKVAVRTGSLGEVEVSLDLVRAIAYTDDEVDLRRFRKEVLPLEGKQDLAVSRAWAQQEGVLEKIDRPGIAFTTGALGTVALGPDKIVGARFRQFGKPPAPPPGLRARLDLADGGILSGKLLGYRNGTFSLDTAAKPGLEVKSGEVRTLSFLGGRIVYISDLAPVDVEERAKVVSVVFKHREDQSVTGNPLRLGGTVYRKGLGVHAYTRLVYKLEGRFARFRALIGLDDEAREIARTQGTPGHVRFQVLVGEKPALGENGIALSTDAPGRAIDVDVAGAKAITLVADFGDTVGPDVLARGVFADAYLVKN